MFRYALPLLLFASSCFAAEAVRKDEAARMDETVAAYANVGEFMGTVLVARGDRVVLSKGYGSANLEWNIANAPSTRLRLGSITKQFTAAAILLLEERGKLRIDDPVKKYLPDAPAAWDKITIFHLLTHTSGIPNYTGFAEYPSIEPFAKTPSELLALFRDKPLDFAPGEQWSYSNSGYTVLGCLIEKLGGVSYGEFLRENIFDPLGMKDSGYDANRRILARRASGYVPDIHGFVNAGYVDMSIAFADGGLYSTTEDLLRWQRGLFGGKLLSAASLAKMTTPFKSDYAFGVEVHGTGAGKMIEHDGHTEGFDTTLAYYPAQKLTVVVLGNVNSSAPQKIAADLGAIARGENVALHTARKEVNLPATLLAEYRGVYRLRPGLDVAVTLEGDHLLAQGTGQRKYPLFAESETTFYYKVIEGRIEFVRGKDGKVDRFILHQGGDMPALRVTPQ